ncbi:D-alanyl-D-alanine carboxypeptidase [Acidocella aminolytica 101 = DSM 11237]|nr:D-alanyl-D-alanine carboxypeptidase [Acidocella aminolytica 101 = DSM 11237]
MQVRSKGRLAMLAIAGMYVAGALVPLPASANEHRYHHAASGPTSPGISSILVDARTGKIISAHDEDVSRYPASLTKLMTLDLAFQALVTHQMTLDTRIPISSQAASVEPVKLGLRPGENITVRDAILAMTTMSANDAATALGQYLGHGSLTRFAHMMNERAHVLGMGRTRFTNPSGLPSPYQVTTARDLSMLTRNILCDYPQFQDFFEVTSFQFRGRTIFSNNGMLKSYAGATGMKTGYTNLARHNLITTANRHGRELIGVVLHEPSWGTAYTQMTAMLDHGFGGHVPMTHAMVEAANHPASPDIMPARPEVETVASRTPEHVTALPDSPRHEQAAGKQWVAQLGLYYYKTNARYAALKARRLHGRGIAQIEHVHRHGKDLWLAQLTGLTHDGAHDTCHAMNAHGRQCDVLRMDADHLAMLDTSEGT